MSLNVLQNRLLQSVADIVTKCGSFSLLQSEANFVTFFGSSLSYKEGQKLLQSDAVATKTIVTKWGNCYKVAHIIPPQKTIIQWITYEKRSEFV